MSKNELKSAIGNWILEHPNRYNQSIEEKVYWTMLDLLNILSSIDDTNTLTINSCENIYNRFRFYY